MGETLTFTLSAALCSFHGISSLVCWHLPGYLFAVFSSTRPLYFASFPGKRNAHPKQDKRKQRHPSTVQGDIALDMA